MHTWPMQIFNVIMQALTRLNYFTFTESCCCDSTMCCLSDLKALVSLDFDNDSDNHDEKNIAPK